MSVQQIVLSPVERGQVVERTCSTALGQFNVGAGDIATFQNGVSFNLNGTALQAGLPTSNILARVTGGNLSSIYGTIQTSGFGTANLFLMNPAGFLFGPNATVNVGGLMTFATADYLKLTDGSRFNAIPNATADALLTPSPVAALDFLDLIRVQSVSKAANSLSRKAPDSRWLEETLI